MKKQHRFPNPTILTVIFTVFFCAAASAEIKYSIDASFEVDTALLSGTAHIELTAGDIPDDDVLFCNIVFEDGRKLEVKRLLVDGVETSIQMAGNWIAVPVPSERTSAGLAIEMEYQLTDVPEFEGVYTLDDNKRQGTWSSWYPRLVAKDGIPAASYEVNFTLGGPGFLASSSSIREVTENGNIKHYHLSDPSAEAMALLLSPIFHENRVQVADCNLGLFVREGSEKWGSLLLQNVAEVYGFYKEAIPAFARTRLDVVLAGEDYNKGMVSPFLVVIKDELDKMAEEFGGVFTSNFLRWKSSEALASVFWGSVVRQEENSIPWLREGLALYFAERYSEKALLGGPVFDNIRMFYLNAAAGKVSTSLNQTYTDAEKSGLDPDRVLAQSKGLWVVGMLADELGNNNFQRFLTRLVDTKTSEPITNARIQKLAEDVAGRSLEKFFAAWVRGDAKIDYGIGKLDNGNNVIRAEIRNHGTFDTPVEVTAIFEDGSSRRETVKPGDDSTWISFNGNQKVRRLIVDPDERLPDINRGDNMRSFGGSERIESLYSIDRYFDIGEITLVSPPVDSGESRIGEFEVTITNKSDNYASLGLRLTAAIPGQRNRGISRLFFEFSPGETRTLREKIVFPAEGKGLAHVSADYFRVSDREHFERLGRNDPASLTNYYVFNIAE